MSKTMRILNGDAIKTIPWALICEHERQAQTNHGQTLDGLNGRGGLSACEALAIIHDRRWIRIEKSVAEAQLCDLVRCATVAASPAKANDNEREACAESQTRMAACLIACGANGENNQWVMPPGVLRGFYLYASGEKPLPETVTPPAQAVPSSHQAVPEAFKAAFLKWNGFHTEAEIAAEWDAHGGLCGAFFREGISAMTSSTTPAVNTPDNLAQQYKLQRDNLLAFIRKAPVSSGVCCCGEEMQKHDHPMTCGHTPVDTWDHAVLGFCEEIEAFDKIITKAIS